jgi:hypothetical protein
MFIVLMREEIGRMAIFGKVRKRDTAFSETRRVDD